MKSTHHLMISAGLMLLGCASAAPLDASGEILSNEPPLPVAGEQPRASDGACSTNQQCIERNSGAPYRCRPSDQQCVSVLSPECPRVLGAAGVARDDSVYVGLLVVDDPDGAEAEAAVELARSEIELALGGVATSASSAIRPLVVIVCKTDGEQPHPAARHLVQEVGVSALLSGLSSADVLSVAREYAIPAGVLQIATGSTDNDVSELDDRDLVYGAQIPDGILGQVLTPFIAQILRPAIDAAAGTTEGEPLRVMLVYDPDATGEYRAITSHLSIDGQPVSNGDTPYYREVRLDPLNFLDPQPLAVVAARGIINFAPHVIVYLTRDEAVLQAVEGGWPTDVPRPYFVVSSAMAAQLPQVIGVDADRRRRAYALLGIPDGFDPTSFDAWAQRLGASAPTLTRPISRIYGPNLYDSVYLLSDAISTLGDRDATGQNLVPGWRRLGGPGLSIPLGPGALLAARDELAAGRSIDYVGVNGYFHFTPEGDRIGLAGIGCVTIDASGKANGVMPSGFVYDPATRLVVSAALSCP